MAEINKSFSDVKFHQKLILRNLQTSVYIYNSYIGNSYIGNSFTRFFQ